MLSFGCDDRECRVLLHEGVRIVEHTACSLGDPDGVDLDGVDPDGSLHLAHADGSPCDVPPSSDVSRPPFCSAEVIPSLDVSQPPFCSAEVPPSLDVSHPADISGWERRAFQLPRSDISRSADSAYPESLAAILHSADSAYPESSATILHSAAVFS